MPIARAGTDIDTTPHKRERARHTSAAELMALICSLLF